MAAQDLWHGFAEHGFASAEALDYSLDNAKDRFSRSEEACARLMNGARFATANPGCDCDPHEEFHRMVISQPHYQNFRVQSGYTQRGWLGYKMDHGERTVEKPATSLKVDHVIELPCQQLNGNRRYRRRVSLPDQLVPPGGEIYYLLEYKSYPNMDYRQRALLLAQEAAEAAAAAQAVAAPQDVAALQAVAAGQGDEDQGDAAVAAGQGDEDQGDAAVAAAQGDEGQDDADHSSSDDTYVPNEDEDYDL